MKSPHNHLLLSPTTSSRCRNVCARSCGSSFSISRCCTTVKERPIGRLGPRFRRFWTFWRSCRAAMCAATCIKELDHQLGVLERFQQQPGVDDGRLGTLIHNLVASRDELSHIGTAFLNPLKDCEFLNAIKHRSAIPGGTCEFDLPEYNHWLRQPFERRQQDMDKWMSAIRPVCDAVSELLWLIRESAQPSEKMAINGMYQHSMQKGRKLPLVAGHSCGRQLAVSGDQRQPAPIHGALSRMVHYRQPRCTNRPRRTLSAIGLLKSALATSDCAAELQRPVHRPAAIPRHQACRVAPNVTPDPRDRPVRCSRR